MKVWDSYIRFYHWLQVGLIIGCWWTAEEGYMEWHLTLAAGLIGLWVSRIIWGFIGSETARFSKFVKGPASVFQFAGALLAGKIPHQVGHNPVGALMVVALLLLIAVQWFTGLFTSDDIFIEGPLYSMVSDDFASLMGQIHHLNFDLIVILVVVHVLAVVLHQFKGEKIVGAMITGKRADLAGEPSLVNPKMANSLTAWIIAILVGFGCWWWIADGFQ
ncbi:MAG: cytochrome b/b6 domain-containing protein [Oceanobacter sp.]